MTITLKRVARFGRVDVSVVDPEQAKMFAELTGRSNVRRRDMEILGLLGVEFLLQSEWLAYAPKKADASLVFDTREVL